MASNVCISRISLVDRRLLCVAPQLIQATGVNLRRVKHGVEASSAAFRSDFGCFKPVQKTSRRLYQFEALPVDTNALESEGEVGAMDLSEPWLGAVLFRRSAIKTHYEFLTCLERLGLSLLSSEPSRTSVVSMGLKPTPLEVDDEEGTPVAISIDAAREGESKDLRLHGIVRSAITLRCNRCLAPCVKRVFADFTLLLTEKPVVEPTQQNLGVVLGKTSSNSFDLNHLDLDIDLDDKLHFPPEEKEVDLSKYIRDTIHLEIPAKSLCSGDCLGLCLTCGVSLNRNSCSCSPVEERPSWGPLEQLKVQLQEQERDDNSKFAS